MSHRALGSQFADQIEDSLVDEHSPEAEKSREGWVYHNQWPHAYLNEVSENENYQEMLQGNLRRMGAGDTIRVRRRGEPRGPITNASLFHDWQGKLNDSPDIHEWEVPIKDVVGFGHPGEGEVFVRHREAK